MTTRRPLGSVVVEIVSPRLVLRGGGAGGRGRAVSSTVHAHNAATTPTLRIIGVEYTSVLFVRIGHGPGRGRRALCACGSVDGGHLRRAGHDARARGHLVVLDHATREPFGVG